MTDALGPPEAMTPAFPTDRTSEPPRPRAYAGIFLASLGILMLEVLLTRVFSFTVWYHLAYLTISTALLGFAAAGTALSLRPAWLADGGARAASLATMAAGLTLLLGIALIAPRPISPDRLLGEPGAFFVELLAYYAVVAIPFFFGGVAVAAPLAGHPLHANRLYAADLLGAGFGCGLAVLSLSWLDGPGAITACAAILTAAGALYAPTRTLRLPAVAGAVLISIAIPYADRAIEFVPTRTKVLGAALADPHTEVLHTRWSPVNRVDVYRSQPDRFGYWAGIGRSTRNRELPPRTLSIQYDGHNGSNIFEVGGDATLAFLDGHLLATPYEIGERKDVLVIGVGGGIDVLNALHHGATRVTGVELQPITVDVLKNQQAEWTDGWFNRPEVELVAAEGRHFVRSRPGRHDLIQITMVDTFSAQTTGAYVLAESYLYTVEAFLDYLDRLEEGGVISLVIGDPLYRDESLPPPMSTRLALTAREALERRGASAPTDHLMMIGRPRPATGADPSSPIVGGVPQNLMIKKTPFTAEEIDAVRSYAERNGFRVHFAPGSSGLKSFQNWVETPRHALETKLRDGRFDLRPVTDDDPFFYNLLPWRSLLTGEQVWWVFPGSAIGQVVLLMMLGQAILLGGLLIVAPLLARARNEIPLRQTLGYLAYFLALGLGFLLIEISFVQKYVLLLGYPTYSLSVTILSLLVFAALGAWSSRRFWREDLSGFLTKLLASTLVLVGLEVVALPWIREAAIALPFSGRVVVTVLLQMPIGIALGMYFPTGLELLRRSAPQLIPWAWAVNGVASVASTVLAVILGMELGFSAVAWTALCIYAVGTLALVGTEGARAPS